MENEVSSISKLGIVLIALAVLIGLAFGIFQISKGTANTGVNNVQEQLDSVSASTYTTYDQTTITGTMVRSAVNDFEGKSCAILIANQAWINLQAKAGAVSSGTSTITSGGALSSSVTTASLTNANTGNKLYTQGSGFTQAYLESGNTIPVVAAFASNDEMTDAASKTASSITSKSLMTASDGTTVYASFINYNTVIGNSSSDAAGVMKNITATFASYAASSTTNSSGTTTADHTFYMGGIYFDTNRYICTSGYATDTSGKTLFNNITGNLSKTGKTEFIPTGAKFQSYLLKDASGTTMGIVLQQVSN
jgi:hypothetical protein